MSFLRLGGKHAGSFIALTLSRQNKKIRNSLGIALMPQAGVAIALAFEAGKILNNSQLGNLLISVIMSATIINEIFSPFLVKLALKRSGDLQENSFENT